ncbi:MAG: hypothetical protein ACFE75_09080 [Candidatus Hodarchaeota archaeon]
MSFITKKGKEEKTTFGVIVGNRDVFPDHLAKEGRNEIIEVLKQLGYEYIVLNEDGTNFGVVETYQEAKKCAELFAMKNIIIFRVFIQSRVAYLNQLLMEPLFHLS